MNGYVMMPTVSLWRVLGCGALCASLGVLSGCSTGVSDSEIEASLIKPGYSNKSASGAQAKADSVLNYSISELKEIDLTLASEEKNWDTEDLWVRVIMGFRLNQGINPRIQREIDFYRTHPKMLSQVLTRAKPYLYLIVKEIEARNMPTEMALLPIIESSFHPDALSGANASGMWQFTPDTAERRGIKNNWWFDGRRDIYLSTNAALDYLQNLYGRSEQDWLLALAGYNWGVMNVRSAIKKNRAKNKSADYWSLKMPNETQRYVPKLLALARIIESPEKYGLVLPDIPNLPYLTRIEIDQQIDLSTAAQMADMPWDEFQRINAGHKRIATDPKETTHVLVPIDKLRNFAINIAKFAPQTKGNWISHSVSVGDRLDELAMRYDTSVALIVKLNHLKANPTPGQTLLIAVGEKTLNPEAEETANATLATTLSLESREQANKRQMTEKKEALRNARAITHKLQGNYAVAALAKSFNVSSAALAKLNGVSESAKFHKGQSVLIPVSKVVNLTAKKGDTWHKLATANRIPVFVLAHFNDRKPDDKIAVGQIVRIPKFNGK